MSHKHETPPMGVGGVRNDLACLLIVPEHTTAPDPIQAARVAWVMRRLPIDAAMAQAVAALAFSVSEVR